MCQHNPSMNSIDNGSKQLKVNILVPVYSKVMIAVKCRYPQMSVEGDDDIISSMNLVFPW